MKHNIIAYMLWLGEYLSTSHGPQHLKGSGKGEKDASSGVRTPRRGIAREYTQDLQDNKATTCSLGYVVVSVELGEGAFARTPYVVRGSEMQEIL